MDDFIKMLIEKKTNLINKAVNGTLKEKTDKALLEIFRTIAKISMNKDLITDEEVHNHEIISQAMDR